MGCFFFGPLIGLIILCKRLFRLPPTYKKGLFCTENSFVKFKGLTLNKLGLSSFAYGNQKRKLEYTLHRNNKL